MIDVESVEVEKKHFMEAMSAITPTAHRCSVVHSRPFSLVVSLCLQSHLQNAMRVISDIFPVLEISSESSKFSMVVSGFSIPLVYRPGLLLCGIEGVGLVIFFFGFDNFIFCYYLNGGMILFLFDRIIWDLLFYTN